MKLFLDAGASLDIQYTIQWPETPLFDVAISEAPLDYFEPLEYTGRITPLISALSYVDMAMIRFLLNNGASPNLPDQNGVTPLMHAVKQVGNDCRLFRFMVLQYAFLFYVIVLVFSIWFKCYLIYREGSKNVR